MCGICGFAGHPLPLDEARQVAGAMNDTLRHRGPDDEGYFVAPGVALAMRRLSIIDLGGGHQPIFNADRTACIVYNGELYNYHALRAELERAGHHFATQSDTEVTLQAYERWGTNCLERLNGMFAFAIWDSRRAALFIARDRAGIKPLYYAQVGGHLVFGSELKALLRHPDVPRRLDLAALDQYLAFEYVPTPRTILQDVRRLRPGHFLRFDEAGLHEERYWDFHLRRSETQLGRDEEEWVEELRATLFKAVKLEMVSDVPIGVLLSGGIDSSAVAAAMRQATASDLDSFTIGFTDRSFDESRFARRVAERLGTRHHEEILEAPRMHELLPEIMGFLDEPLADSSIIPTYLLSRFTRQHVTVALGGDAGDELFAGYSTLQAHRLALPFDRVPRALRGLAAPLVDRLPVSFDNISLDFKIKRFASGLEHDLPLRHHTWLGCFGPRQRRGVLAPERRQQLEAAGPDAYQALDEHLAACDARHPLNRVLYLDMKLYMEGDILPKVDRASMACSLEVRVPLLNRVMLDFAERLPFEWKLHGLRTKYLLRRAMEPYLPADILARGKKGFNIPVARWLTADLQPLLQEQLAPERLRRQGLFDPDAVQRLVDEHRRRRRDNRKQLWALLVFQLWLDRIQPEIA